LRDNFSAYDATYVALAAGLGIPLLTRDARIATAAREQRACRIELLSREA